MSGAMEPLLRISGASGYSESAQQKSVLGVFVGTGLTLLIQRLHLLRLVSLQNLYASDLISLQGALPVLWGWTISGRP